MIKRRAAPLLTALMLSLTSLACALTAEGPDTRATVDAAYARLTAEAQTGPGGPELDKGETPGTPDPTSEVTPTPQPDTPTPSLTPTPPATRADNGPLVEVPPCANEIILDANPEDWAGQERRLTLSAEEATFGQEDWTGPADASADISLCWASDALYLLAEVTDDAHVQTEEGASAFRGDEIEISFDGDLRGDFYTTRLTGDDRQFGLSPGDFEGLPPSAVVFHPEIDTDPAIDLTAARPIGAGGNYTLEAQIPWEEFGVTPDTSAVYGLCVNVSDNDQPGEALQQSYVSTCEDLNVFDPTTYISMRLVP
jgi:hypothetical protein